jgi:hypothetical protein
MKNLAYCITNLISTIIIMIKITQEQFNKAKEKAFKHYEKHKKVISPLL